MRLFMVGSICLIVFCGGCSTTVETARGRVAPVSYSTYTGTKEYGIGLLRRIAILPPQYVYMHDGKRQPAKEAEATDFVQMTSVDFLQNWRGYEVIKPEESMVPGGVPALSETDLKSLYDWMGSTPIGSALAGHVRDTIDVAIGEAKVDGIMLFRGFQQPPSTWNVALVILTASMSFPLVLAESRGELEAAIIERSSGCLVWRSKKPMYNASQPLSNHEIHVLLDSLERAVPAALTE